jgi:hypothetical protein
MTGVASLCRKWYLSCDPAAVRCGRRSAASCIEFNKHGAGRSNNGCNRVAPLARQLRVKVEPTIGLNAKVHLILPCALFVLFAIAACLLADWNEPVRHRGARAYFVGPMCHGGGSGFSPRWCRKPLDGNRFIVVAAATVFLAFDTRDRSNWRWCC